MQDYLRTQSYQLFSFCEDNATLQFSEDEPVDLVRAAGRNYVICYIYCDFFGDHMRRFDTIGELTCAVAALHNNIDALDPKYRAELNRVVS